MGTRSKSIHPIRRELAHNAAKLIAVDGINDYFIAKKKAADMLGVEQSQYYPSNKEIEEALIDYQQLFQQDLQPLVLHTLRNKALKALQLFEPLEPYLVGSILSGTANEYSEIILHIFTESPEAVTILLLQHQIPFEECEKRARFKHRESQFYPAFQFFAEQHKVLLIVFPERQRHHPPLDPIDGQPIQRANFQELSQLINHSTTAAK